MLDRIQTATTLGPPMRKVAREIDALFEFTLAGPHDQGCHLRQAVPVELRRLRNQLDRGTASSLGHLSQAAGIGGEILTGDDDRVGLGSDGSDRGLAVGRRVADVAAWRLRQIGEACS